MNDTTATTETPNLNPTGANNTENNTATTTLENERNNNLRNSVNAINNDVYADNNTEIEGEKNNDAGAANPKIENTFSNEGENSNESPNNKEIQQNVEKATEKTNPVVIFDNEIKQASKKFNGKQKRDLKKTTKNEPAPKPEKEKFTIAAIFSKTEYEQIMKLYTARLENGLSIDRNHFLRQIMQFALNAHKFDKPKFGMPDDFSIDLDVKFLKTS